MKRSTKNPPRISPVIDKNQVIVTCMRKVLKLESIEAMKDQLKNQLIPLIPTSKNNFLAYPPRKNAKIILNNKYYTSVLTVRLSVFAQSV